MIVRCQSQASRNDSGSVCSSHCVAERRDELGKGFRRLGVDPVPDGRLDEREPRRQRGLVGRRLHERDARAGARVGVALVVAGELLALMSATSSRVRANTPTWSSARESLRMPCRGINPYVGLNPNTPQNAAGRMTEPLVWLPTASGTMPAATAAAEPDDDPPGVCSALCGLRVLPGG